MTEIDRLLRRREALIAAGGIGALGAAALIGGPRSFGGLALDDADAASCVLSPELTEGPYYVDNKLSRRDIREGKKGVVLQLRMKVVNATSCAAIKGADVEIWHAAADGEYSAFDGNSSSRYLRGHQKSGSDGVAEFITVWPGWYRGRTPHIHVKVHVGGSVVHTGQLFFKDAESATVYKTSAYSGRGTQDTKNSSDNIYGQDGGKSLVATSRRRGGGYVGRVTLGVKS